MARTAIGDVHEPLDEYRVERDEDAEGHHR
jgi:hypothetical protein